MKPVEFVLVGAGARGADSYAPYALQAPQDAKIIAVAEPDAQRRARVAAQHGIPAHRCYASYQELFAEPRLAEAALICTQDNMHVEPAVQAMRLGYHVLLEKPMAPSPQECTQLVMVSEQTKRHLVIGHVLRYTDFFAVLHDIVTSGRLGDLITVAHRENVSHWHMAHSFVRGNWRNKALSTPMILAKCCHDLDIMAWNINRECLKVASFGNLSHYRAENAPAGSTQRCLDGCAVEATCPWSAKRIYLDLEPFPDLQPLAQSRGQLPDMWPFNVLSYDTSYAARETALKNGPYGRCVFHCDNDVVDHQVVTMEFAGGLTASLTMHGMSHEEDRTMRYDGTKATLTGVFGKKGGRIEIHPHRGTPEIIEVDGRSGHGGGDSGIMRGFVAAVRGEAAPLSTASQSLASHLMAFAAEDARIARTVVDMPSYTQQLRAEFTA